jgi:hypothetical protein
MTHGGPGSRRSQPAGSWLTAELDRAEVPVVTLAADAVPGPAAAG